MLKYLPVLFLLVFSSPTMASDELATLRAELIGTWVIAADETRALSHDLEKHPWIMKKLEQLISDEMTWTFTEEGRYTMGSNRGDEHGFFRLFIGEEAATWIAFGGEKYILGRITLVDGSLRLLLQGQDEDAGEFPVVGELVLNRE